jgi:para-aminobenzoate synthetase component 1
VIVELGPMPRERLLRTARALDREKRGVALLDGSGWGGVRLGVDPVEELRVPLGEAAMPEIALALDRLEGPSDRGFAGRTPAFRWVGYIAYESARSLERPQWTRGRGVDEREAPCGEALLLRRYAAVARRDDDTGVVAIEGDDLVSIGRLSAAIARASDQQDESCPLALAPSDDDRAHEARIRRVLELIARGDVYVVNIARAYEAKTTATSTSLLLAMQQRATARFGAAIDLGDHALVSTSPELFLDVARPGEGARRVKTSPIKGTRPRGLDAAEDAALVRELENDPKERAELTMVVDLERNDLGRVATTGSVRVVGPPRIESSRTLHHRVQDVVGEVPAGVGLGRIVGAMFPSGSVTGAPKVRAMEIIAELEPRRRGVYCGAILAIGRDSSARSAMAIRTLVVDRRSDSARYDAGGGIVTDSDPLREVAETGWKARQVVPR